MINRRNFLKSAAAALAARTADGGECPQPYQLTPVRHSWTESNAAKALIDEGLVAKIKSRSVGLYDTDFGGSFGGDDDYGASSDNRLGYDTRPVYIESRFPSSVRGDSPAKARGRGNNYLVVPARTHVWQRKLAYGREASQFNNLAGLSIDTVEIQYIESQFVEIEKGSRSIREQVLVPETYVQRATFSDGRKSPKIDFLFVQQGEKAYIVVHNIDEALEQFEGVQVKNHTI